MRQNINEEIKSLRSVFDVEDTVMDTEAEHQGAVEGSDIYKIFDNLYKLFNSLGILSDKPEDIGHSFRFIHAYPDEVKKDDVNIINFRVKSRAPAISKNKAVPTSNFTSRAPRSMFEEYNDVTGMYENNYQQTFDNVIVLTIFSTKARAVNLLAQILESIFMKYKREISPMASTYFYLGMSDIGFLDRYDQEPIFTRELAFHFVTTEMFTMETEKVAAINLKATN